MSALRGFVPGDPLLWGCPMNCGLFKSTLGLFPPYASSIPTLVVTIKECPQTLPSVPLEVKSSMVEKHCFRIFISDDVLPYVRSSQSSWEQLSISLSVKDQTNKALPNPAPDSSLNLSPPVLPDAPVAPASVSSLLCRESARHTTTVFGALKQNFLPHGTCFPEIVHLLHSLTLSFLFK